MYAIVRLFVVPATTTGRSQGTGSCQDLGITSLASCAEECDGDSNETAKFSEEDSSCECDGYILCPVNDEEEDPTGEYSQ